MSLALHLEVFDVLLLGSDFSEFLPVESNLTTSGHIFINIYTKLQAPLSTSFFLISSAS